MSYILDALKKAEAERQLGSVPNLYAQPAAALPANTTSMQNVKPALLIAGVLLGIACAALVWFKPWQSVPGTVAPVLPTAPKQLTPPPAIALAPPSAIPVPLTSHAAAPEIIAISPAPEIPAKPPAAAKPKKAAAVAKRRESAIEKQPIRQAAVPAASAKPSQNDADLKLSTTLAQQEPQDTGAASLRELPEQIQRELPKIAIGGYIYSGNQRERQLLVNKRLLHEGDEAAPGVVLEKMLPKAAVFNYKGYRYRVAY